MARPLAEAGSFLVCAILATRSLTSTPHFKDRQPVVADGIDSFAGLVQLAVAGGYRKLDLRINLSRRGGTEHEEAISMAAGGEQPLASGVKFDVFDHGLAVAGEIAKRLSRPGVEEFDTGFSVQVVNIADLADTAHRERGSAGRKG